MTIEVVIYAIGWANEHGEHDAEALFPWLDAEGEGEHTTRQACLVSLVRRCHEQMWREGQSGWWVFPRPLIEESA